jgi:predicted RNA binding protein YcfA (HicA-like mRNA interferase family)
VDDEILKKIQEAPPVRDRNRSPQVITEQEEVLVGVATDVETLSATTQGKPHGTISNSLDAPASNRTETPYVAKVETTDSISVRNEAPTDSRSGGSTTSNPSNDLNSSSRPHRSEDLPVEPSPQTRLDQKMIEQKFDTLIDLMDKFSNNNLDFRGQTNLIQEARELATKGYPEILQGLSESGVIGELERSELISYFIDSKKINKLSQADYAILAATLLDEEGNSIRPEITSQLTEKKLERLQRVFAEPDADVPIHKALRNTPVREIIKIVEADGWMLSTQRGSHRQFVHRTKPGRVTISGGDGDTLPEGTLKSVFTQAGLNNTKE